MYHRKSISSAEYVRNGVHTSSKCQRCSFPLRAKKMLPGPSSSHSKFSMGFPMHVELPWCYHGQTYISLLPTSLLCLESRWGCLHYRGTEWQVLHPSTYYSSALMPHLIPGPPLHQSRWLSREKLQVLFLPLAGTAGGTSAFSFCLLPFCGCSGTKLVTLVTVSPELQKKKWAQMKPTSIHYWKPEWKRN